MGRLLITIGILFVVIGLFVEFGPHFLPLGHLPGDISITGKHGSFYFPVVSCIVVSIVLNVILCLFIDRGSIGGKGVREQVSLIPFLHCAHFVSDYFLFGTTCYDTIKKEP